MRKRLLVMAAVWMGIISPAFANEIVTVDGVNYTIAPEEEFNYAYVSGLADRSLESVTIQDIVASADGKEYEVKLIGRSAFSYCTGLKSVTLPQTLVWIDGYSFMGTGLSEIILPEKLESIGNSAFANCNSLESVTFIGGTALDNFVFSNDKNLEAITLPASMADVSPIAFRGCTALAEINVDAANERYSSKDGIVYSKDGKTLEIYPAGKDLEPEIEEGVVAIGRQAFYQTSIQWIELPESLEEIGDEAFSFCTGLEEFELSANVRVLGESVFNGCSQLTSIKLNDTLETIGAKCFSTCSKLTGIDIPDSVTSLGNMALQSCSALKDVYIGSGIGQLPYGLFSFSGIENVTIAEGVKMICETAFSSCGKLTSIELPNSVETIEASAFWGCYNLTDVTFGSGVKEIAGLAFLGLTGIKNITVGAVVPPAIQENTFAAFTSNLYVPEESVDAYKDDAIWGNFAEILPIKSTEVAEVVSSGSLRYENKMIYSGSDYKVDVYNVKGERVISVSGAESCSLESLPAGLYIAVAGDKVLKIML